jgi:hypothetical protein
MLCSAGALPLWPSAIDPGIFDAQGWATGRRRLPVGDKFRYCLRMAILKNAGKAIIDERKIRDYSLNPNHIEGGHKARLIRATTGLTRIHFRDLIEQIKQGILVCEAVSYRDYKGNPMFTVRMPVTGPKGTATLITGWIYDEGSDAPRLTTAYIARP